MSNFSNLKKNIEQYFIVLFVSNGSLSDPGLLAAQAHPSGAPPELTTQSGWHGFQQLTVRRTPGCKCSLSVRGKLDSVTPPHRVCNVVSRLTDVVVDCAVCKQAPRKARPSLHVDPQCDTAHPWAAAIRATCVKVIHAICEPLPGRGL